MGSRVPALPGLLETLGPGQLAHDRRIVSAFTQATAPLLAARARTMTFARASPTRRLRDFRIAHELPIRRRAVRGRIRASTQIRQYMPRMASRSAELACTYCGMRAISTHGLTTAMTRLRGCRIHRRAGAGDGYALEPSVAPSGMRCCCTGASFCCSAGRVRAASRHSATKPTTTTRPTAQAAMRMFRRRPVACQFRTPDFRIPRATDPVHQLHA